MKVYPADDPTVYIPRYGQEIVLEGKRKPRVKTQAPSMFRPQTIYALALGYSMKDVEQNDLDKDNEV